MPEPKDAIRRELLRIEEDCSHSGKAQFNASDRWSSYHFWLGLPAIALSAVASTAFIKDQVVAASVMTGLAAMLTSFQTFMKPSERAAAHRSAGGQYLGLKNDARVFREIRLDHVCDDQAALDGLEELNKRRKELNLASPQFAKRDFEKARRGINAGEALHQIDKKE